MDLCKILTISLLISYNIAAPSSHGDFINPGTPDGVTVSFDCEVRKYALQYGQSLQPRHGSSVHLFDALQLESCNMSRPTSNTDTSSTQKPVFKPSAQCSYYIDAVNGNDANDGSLNSPFLTIKKGIITTRKQRTGNELCELNLFKGTFYLNDTIELNDIDSYLTIQNYNGADVIISGGRPLQFEDDWNLYNYTKTEWQNYSNMNNVWGRADNANSNDLVKYLGQASSYKDCIKMAEQQINEIYHSITWHDSNFDGWAQQCYAIKDESWQPVQEQGVYSARYIGKNIWSRKVSNINEISGLRVNGKRAIRARYHRNICFK